MLTKTSRKKTGGKTPYLHVVAKQNEELTIKIFDINGKKAKTLSKATDLSLVDLNTDIIDLAKGQYVMNAFKGGNFIRSFRFIKE